MKTYSLSFLILLLSVYGSYAGNTIQGKIEKLLETETLKRAGAALTEEPVTITSFKAERSMGGRHDFYSEGDYWWPNPQDPDGPYIRRDGETNPDNFTSHRKVMIRMSQIVGDLTSAYLLTRDTKYVEAAMKHIRAWFVDQATLMNPNLLYAQAIKGVVSGRGVGIIDTIHLIEVARSLYIFEENNLIEASELKALKLWFSDYLTWMSTHRYGINEMNAKNNHGTCWVMQASAFAKFTGDQEMLRFCKERYKNTLLPNQMAGDGSFPLETARTKPYGYSLFNLDAMTTICHILSTENENLWEYTTPDSKNMQKGVSYLFSYVKDKSRWPFDQDIMFWEEWPVAHPFLLFSFLNSYNKDYYKVWAGLEHFPVNEEVIRNLPIRHPLIWLNY